MRPIRTLHALLPLLLLAGTAAADPAAPAPPAPSTGAPAPAGVAPSPSPQQAAPAPPSGAEAAPATPPPPMSGQPPPMMGPAPAPSPEAMYGQPVPVTIVGDSVQGLPFAIYPEWATPGTVPPLVRCRMPCGVQLVRGKYRLAIPETQDALGGSRVITVDGPERLVVSPRDRGQRTVGLVLGIGGAVAVVGGIVLLVVGVHDARIAAGCDAYVRCDVRWNSEMTTGTIITLAGAAMTPIGWVLFGKSLRPGVEVQRGMVAARPAGRVGLVALPGGVGLGGSGTF